MGDTRDYALRRFAPINLVGDRIDLECKDHGQIHEIVLLRSLMHRPCEHESMGDTHSHMRSRTCVREIT